MKNTIYILIFVFIFIQISILLQPSHGDTEEITVIAIGDITVGSNLTPTIEKQGAGVFFEGTASVIQSADIATASLNTSISERGEPDPSRELRFRAVPDLARALSNAGFDAISLATPHIMDFGFEAFEDTLTHLEWYNVKPIGAGISPAAANAPTWIDVNSKKVALLAYLRGNEFNMASLNLIASAAFSQMTRAVKEINDTAEIVIVWLHWGKQESDTTREQSSIGRQRIFAQALIDAGADLVLCQQLHTFGGIELYEGKPIIYSLADFIYETYSLQYARTIIPKVTFAEGALKSIELIPILVDKPGASFPQPSLLKIKDTTKESLDIKLEETAIETLKEYQKRCAVLNTEVIIKGERGWISIINTSN
ncbi:MAG: CapA family protein [Candidatus Poribacteria bacterium]|nr:CapA family protein [Candidatus Poribacteria bacterium]